MTLYYLPTKLKLVVILVFLLALGCKKNAEEVSISDNGNKLLDELIIFSTKNKSDLHLVLKTGKINWKVVSERFSTSPTSPFHMTFPIIENGRNCRKLLDVSFSLDHKINGVHLINAELMTSSIDNNLDSMERDVILRQMYDFSKLGIKISSSVSSQIKHIPNPNQIIGIKQKLISKTKFSQNDKIQGINPNCLVAGNWNFSIGYYYDPMLYENTSMTAYVRYRLETYLSEPNNAFQGWSGFGGGTYNGNYTFFNADTGQQVEAVLYEALQRTVQDLFYLHARPATVASFSFSFNSTCGGNSTGGGNIGASGNANDLHNKVDDPCIKSSVAAALNGTKNIIGVMADIIRGLDENVTVTIDIMDTTYNSNGRAGKTSGTQWKVDPVTNKVVSFKTNITLSKYHLESSSRQYLVVVLMHEVLHAYFRQTTSKTEAFNNEDHGKIAANYIKPMAEYLAQLFAMPLEDAYALAWDGAQDTKAYMDQTEFIVGNDANNYPIYKAKAELSEISTKYIVNQKGTSLCD